MPGIAGIISRRPADECQRFVEAMVNSMKHEQFHTSGTCFVPEVGVYGGWVAQEGSFAARQSAITASNGVSLLFSGECFLPTEATSYNSTLPENHYSNHDTNQLLRLYNEKGDRFVEQINGLFSGLLIDRKRKSVLLFNDRYSIERIYYYEQDGTTFFASEAKAILRVVPELRAFDDEGVAQFLRFGCTLENRTLFRNLKFLPGGSIWIFEQNANIRKEQYFHPHKWEVQPTLTEEAFELEFVETFRRILPRYLFSDSPIGISLTGGLDTRMIMACLPKNTLKPVCYTFSGLTENTIDASLAARVAQICELEHHILRIDPDFISNYGNYTDRTVFASDGCAGALSAHEIYLNAKARYFSPVRLTGNFGSEILRSMSTFKPITLSDKLINLDFRLMFDSFTQIDSDKSINPVTFSAFQEIPWNLFGSLAAGRTQLTFRTPYLDNEIVALAFRAPSISRQSPKSALCLVNKNNPDLSRIPTDRGLIWGGHGFKYAVGRVFSEVTFKLDYLHKEGLPNWLLPLNPAINYLSESGLLGVHRYLPYRNWFRKELSNYVSDVLTDPHTQQLQYWNSSFLSSIATDHRHGRKNYIREIHAVLTLEAVERLLIRSSSVLSGHGSLYGS